MFMQRLNSGYSKIFLYRGLLVRRKKFIEIKFKEIVLYFFSVNVVTSTKALVDSVQHFDFIERW